MRRRRRGKDTINSQVNKAMRRNGINRSSDTYCVSIQQIKHLTKSDNLQFSCIYFCATSVFPFFLSDLPAQLGVCVCMDVCSIKCRLSRHGSHRQSSHFFLTKDMEREREGERTANVLHSVAFFFRLYSDRKERQREKKK